MFACVRTHYVCVFHMFFKISFHKYMYTTLWNSCVTVEYHAGAPRNSAEAVHELRRFPYTLFVVAIIEGIPAARIERSDEVNVLRALRDNDVFVWCDGKWVANAMAIHSANMIENWVIWSMRLADSGVRHLVCDALWSYHCRLNMWLARANVSISIMREFRMRYAALAWLSQLIFGSIWSSETIAAGGSWCRTNILHSCAV